MSRESGSHFVTDYTTMVGDFLETMPLDEAMAIAIGGNYRPFGILQRQIVLQNGLQPDGYLVDIGCGSGRTAYALRTLPELRYLGIDVVDELLGYATTMCERPDWRFEKTTGLTIPEADGVADMVSAFSLFTHLLHEESYVYLAEARRVLKPGGVIVFSFLDFAIEAHWAVFEINVERIGIPGHLNQFMDPIAIRVWAKHLGLDVVALHRGDLDYATLDEPLTLDDGTVYANRASLGQSLAVLRKPG
jgi:SAM-dependent methyltransferase